MKASTLVGGTPSRAQRPVSLAVKHYVDRYQPTALVIGVSGGADSLALATAALALANRPMTYAVTVDHGVREGSGEEALRVATLLEELGADQAEVRQVVVAGGEGSAREARLTALREFAEGLSAANPDILLGHTMDDQAETVLLSLARGASTRALGAIRERRLEDGVYFGRPLLGVRRADTEAFCQSVGLPVVDDPSNYVDGPWQGADGFPLRRAAVREGALPALNQALRQDVVPALARIAQQAASDEDALMEMLPQTISELRGLPKALRTRGLREAAVQAGARQLSSSQIEQMDGLLVDWRGQGPVHLSGGVRAWRDEAGVHVQRTE